MLLQFYAPFATKMVPVSGVKSCEGGRYQEGRRASLYHRKVSAVETPPGVSGLTSTLTQATFSWLLHRNEEDTRQDELLCKSYGGAKGGEQLQMWDFVR